MNTCERALDVEDLVLGRMVDHDLEAHLETCAECTQTKALFEEERALFFARTAPPPPPLELPPPRRIFPRISAAFVGLAAAITILVYGHPFGVTSECEPSGATADAPPNEPLLCEAPSPAPAMSLASHEPGLPRLPACVESASAICAEPDWLNSSSAMP